MQRLSTQNLYYFVLLFVFSGIMGFFFPSVMYVDDYFFFGLESLGSPQAAIRRISETNSPAYTIYFLFWLLSKFFFSLSIQFYLHFMSFLIWATVTFSLFRFVGDVNKKHKTVFVGLFLLLFLVDRPSNQNLFWSAQAIGSYMQHLFPVMILLNWVTFRPINNRKVNMFRDFLYCFLLFGFPGEILICTLLYIFYLLFTKKSLDIYLLVLFVLGLFFVFLNLYSNGGRNRAAELNRPRDFEDLIGRLLTFYKFLIADNFIFLLICITTGYLIGIMLKFSAPSRVLIDCGVLLAALTIALSVVCASAYQSIYHFIGINLLTQLLGMVCGMRLATWVVQNPRFNLKKKATVTRAYFVLLLIPVLLHVSFTLPQKINWLYNQSHTFAMYSDLLLNNGSQEGPLPVYNFKDSSNLGFIGPNIPEWETYGLVSLDFVTFGVEEAIYVITSRANL